MFLSYFLRFEGIRVRRGLLSARGCLLLGVCGACLCACSGPRKVMRVHIEDSCGPREPTRARIGLERELDGFLQRVGVSPWRMSAIC